MQTPIADFVRGYVERQGVRFHMPGHKGKQFLGCEPYDLTEVKDADALYEAEGIIAASERNASELFGTGRTVYSTEGSSQCIRAMLYLIAGYQKRERSYVLAARNVHKAFLYAAALVDFDVQWLWPKEQHSLCSCAVQAEQIEDYLRGAAELPAAVYLTSPDYLGGQADLRRIAEVCHKYGVILAVDNAHGAYLHFLEEPLHPMDLGVDICCDSAHKTLPVLTGGAYLQISKSAPEYFRKHAKQAMVLFGSTSPSYLILASLDLCNRYLSEGYSEKLAKRIMEVAAVKQRLRDNGWHIEETEALKITIKAPNTISAQVLADMLRESDIECEYADDQYLVCMVTLENDTKDLEKLVVCLGRNEYGTAKAVVLESLQTEQIVSIREAVFAEHETVPVEQAVGRICGSPAVSCPPAIPIVVSGELITEAAISVFQYYGIAEVDVIKK